MSPSNARLAGERSAGSSLWAELEAGGQSFGMALATHSAFIDTTNPIYHPDFLLYNPGEKPQAPGGIKDRLIIALFENDGILFCLSGARDRADTDQVRTSVHQS
jgi:hypothetical protein